MDPPKYKKVSMYDAERGKNVCRTITRSHFKDAEEMDAYIKVIRDEMKAKNKTYRDQERRAGIEAKISLHANNVAPPPVIGTEVMLPPQLQHKPEINLRLDKNCGNTGAIFGSSKRGKSTLLLHLMEKYWSYQVDPDSINTLFSGNPHLKIYKGDPRLLITEGFNQSGEKYIKLQKYINTRTKNKYKFANFFDDILSSKHSSVINSMILSYRNANISMIMCFQYLMMLSKQNRANINFSCIFGCNSSEDMQAIIEHVLKPYFIRMGFNTLAEQMMIFHEVTKNYGFFYIDNLKNTISTCRLQI